MTPRLKRCAVCGASSNRGTAICDLCATPFKRPELSLGHAAIVALILAFGCAVAVASESGLVALMFALLGPATAASVAKAATPAVAIIGVVVGSAAATIAIPQTAKALVGGVEELDLHWSLLWLSFNGVLVVAAVLATTAVRRFRPVEYNG